MVDENTKSASKLLGEKKFLTRLKLYTKQMGYLFVLIVIDLVSIFIGIMTDFYDQKPFGLATKLLNTLPWLLIFICGFIYSEAMYKYYVYHQELPNPTFSTVSLIYVIWLIILGYTAIDDAYKLKHHREIIKASFKVNNKTYSSNNKQFYLGQT